MPIPCAASFRISLSRVRSETVLRRLGHFNGGGSPAVNHELQICPSVHFSLRGNFPHFEVTPEGESLTASVFPTWACHLYPKFLVTSSNSCKQSPRISTVFARLAVSVKGNNGGNIAQYILRTEEYCAAQTQVSFAGRCDSACTLCLSLAPEQRCLRQHAYFRFHVQSRSPDGFNGWPLQS
jgi:hypothetical protein